MKKLPLIVAGKYQVLEGHGVGEYHWNGRVIHLDQLELDDADSLVAAGFPYLVPIPEKKQKASPKSQ